MRQLPVEMSSVVGEAAVSADADNIKSAPIWQNSGSVMALIRCTLPASCRPRPPLHLSSAFCHPSLRVRSPFVPPQFPRPSKLYTHFRLPRNLLSAPDTPRILRLSFPPIFFFSAVSVKGTPPYRPQLARRPAFGEPLSRSRDLARSVLRIMTRHSSAGSRGARQTLGFRGLLPFRGRLLRGLYLKRETSVCSPCCVRWRAVRDDGRAENESVWGVGQLFRGVRIDERDWGALLLDTFGVRDCGVSDSFVWFLCSPVFYKSAASLPGEYVIGQ